MSKVECGHFLEKCKCGGTAHLYHEGGAFWYAECEKCGLKVEGDTVTETLDNWERKVKE